MKKGIKLFFKALTLFFTALHGLLSWTVVLAKEPFLIEGQVTVPNNCQISDTAGSAHTFPKEELSNEYLGVCALWAAKEDGLIESFEFVDFGFGLFLKSVNGLASGDNFNPSWSLYYKGELATVGLADLVIQEGDIISLIYTSFDENFNVIGEADNLILTIVLPAQSEAEGNKEPEDQAVPAPHEPGGGTWVANSSQNLDTEKAVQFLAAKQNLDGSIGNEIFTDWAAIAFGAYNSQHTAADKLKNYFILNPNPGISLGSPVLSFTRRAMALMALGMNPYSGTSINYIQTILSSFDGLQIGDSNLVNDDIFALLVLLKAGYNSSDDIVEKSAQFILSQQRTDGSWLKSTDITAAAIQALFLVSDMEGVFESINKAKIYLNDQQLEDGGFGNSDSTSWAMQAIAVSGQDWRNWKKNGNTPGDYLRSIQKQDGSVESPTPVWSTAYAIPAALGKSWAVALETFPKQEIISDTVLEFSNSDSKLTLEKGTNAYSEELKRISQELSAIKEQALLLQSKITLLAQAEATAEKYDKELAQKRELLEEKENHVLPNFQEPNIKGKMPAAQIGAAVGSFMPHVASFITGTVTRFVSLLYAALGLQD